MTSVAGARPGDGDAEAAAWALSPASSGWSDAGFVGWEACRPWIEVGFNPSLAQAWHDDGVASAVGLVSAVRRNLSAAQLAAFQQTWPDDAFVEWIDVGFKDARDAQAWSEHPDLSPKEAHELQCNDVTPNRFTKWLDRGYSYSDAATWALSGFPQARVANRWRRAGWTPSLARYRAGRGWEP